MASTGSAGKDGSFRDRVDKVFGSLTFSKSSPAWSLSGDEVERREWRRETDTSERDSTPLSSSFEGFSRSRLGKGLGDDDDEREGIDDWEIRSSIGLDPTLDREEEEDEYDKVALGRENAGEWLYMSDVTDHGSYLNSHNVLPKTKDPRANHLAAKMRLEEDEDEGQESDPSKANARKPKKSLVKASENGCQPRSIVKRKDSDTVFKSQKRVRFNHGCKDDSEVRDVETTSDPSIALQNESAVAQNHNTVPDYILNPSKYKHYTFDSSDVEESNSEAYMNLQRSKPTESMTEQVHASAELPKSVTFIPKNKGKDEVANAGTSSSEVRQLKNRAGQSVGIAAREVEQDEASAMDEDVPKINGATKGDDLQKPGQKYRMVSMSDDSGSSES